MQRRQFARAFGTLVLVAVGIRTATSQGDAVRRIAIEAKKFTFSTAEIRARRGETIVLVLTATDFMHGFALPELKSRIDVPPGKSVELALRALPAGRFTYLCDNFCGEGHDKMTGMLVVT